jgi:hypothetical protein
VQHLGLHIAAPVIALVGVVGFIALRLILKTVKVGLLLAAPTLLYLLHQH